MMWLKKFLDKNKLAILGLIVLVGTIVFAVVLVREFKKNQQILKSKIKTEEIELKNTDLVLVEDVVDGDTVRVNQNGESVLVRMLGVDAHELDSKAGTKAKCLADSAKEELTSLVEGKYVELRGDSLNQDKDKYERLLRYIYLDNQNINLRIIENGYARFYRQFPITLKNEFSVADEKGKMVGICDKYNN